jgi:CCR4-NOT transcription complex subunit 6
MKILTYNILSPQLASWSNYKNHKYCNKKYIVWSYRKNKIKKILINSKADILCLQEIQNDIFYDFTPFFYKNGYIGIFIPKNKKNIKNTIDGCAIFIKKTYQFIKIKSIDYESK